MNLHALRDPRRSLDFHRPLRPTTRPWVLAKRKAPGRPGSSRPSGLAWWSTLLRRRRRGMTCRHADSLLLRDGDLDGRRAVRRRLRRHPRRAARGERRVLFFLGGRARGQRERREQREHRRRRRRRGRARLPSPTGAGARARRDGDHRLRRQQALPRRHGLERKAGSRCLEAVRLQHRRPATRELPALQAGGRRLPARPGGGPGRRTGAPGATTSCRSSPASWPTSPRGSTWPSRPESSPSSSP